MRKPFHLLVFVLALALAYATAQTSGSSPSTSNQSQPSQDQTQKPDSQTGASATAMASTDVQSQIQDALKKDPTLSNSNITVSVTDDAVELSGTAASNDEKRAARKIAKTYAGSRQVKDNITVSGDSRTTMPPKGMGFVSAGTYMQSQSTQPQSTQPPPSQSGNTTGTTQSPSTSQSPATEPSNSQQQTPASPDQLPSSQQTTGATAAAGGDIQMQVQNALQKEPTLSSDSITVAVSDDAIELNGNVATSKEKQTARRIAQSYAGNRKVKDHLTVSAGNQGTDKNTTNPPGSMNNPSTSPDMTNPNSKPPSSTNPPRS